MHSKSSAFMIASLFLGLAAAGEFKPGAFDEMALKSLREMAAHLPLKHSTLADVFPKYASDKVDGMTWDEALVKANSTIAKQQPLRAAFLRRYLAKGSPATALKELQWTDSGSSDKRLVSVIYGDPEKPSAEITAVAGSDGLLTRPPILHLYGLSVNAVEYKDLSFDVDDRLSAATLEINDEKSGSNISLGENVTGEKATNFFWVIITGANKEVESMTYSPEFAMRERTVRMPARTVYYREVYENGKLRKRLHYVEKKTEKGTQNVVERTEEFK